MRLLRRRWLPVLAFMAATSCKAGPSAFDRPAQAQGPEDTADAATLPVLPDAPEVETTGVAAPSAPEEEARALVPEEPADTAPETEAGAEAVDAAADTFPDGRLHFEHPEHVRGIYLNAWAAGSTRRVGELLALARRTEINTFVIDIKDATGYVSHRSRVPMAREIGATGEIRIRDLPGLLRRLHDAGIYPIARIVIVKDPLLTAAHPELAVQDTAGGVFTDGKGIVWLNPYDTAMWAYPVALAREVARMGFPEIQWDYIRFPDIPEAEKARVVYPGAGDKPKAQAIHDFLAYSREQLAPLGTKVTADVFGVTASVNRDVGIGQVWEFVIGAVDVALPMVYPSHYWDGSFGFETPNAHPYEIVRRALSDALRRSAEVEGAGNTRPWLQDFSLGKPAYGAPEVRAQIQATYDAGIQEWILWNPGSHYTEEALEPAAGFTSEPTMRVADRVVPVSQRTSVLDSVQAAEAAADSARAAARRARADSVRAAERADSAARAESADTTAGPGAGEPPVPDTVSGSPGRGRGGLVLQSTIRR